MFEYDNGRFSTYAGTQLTRSDASMLCGESGADLAAIHNYQGFSLMRDSYRRQHLSLRTGGSPRFWVGLQVGRNDSNGSMWDDGSPLDPLPPGLSQVSINMVKQQGQPTCAAVNTDADEGGTFLGDCNTQAGFICRGERHPLHACDTGRLSGHAPCLFAMLVLLCGAERPPLALCRSTAATLAH